MANIEIAYCGCGNFPRMTSCYEGHYIICDNCGRNNMPTELYQTKAEAKTKWNCCNKL